jgi:hypothetical protein
MKNIILYLCLACLVSGCASINQKTLNPFDAFSANDIDRVLICFEDKIYGPEKNENLNEPEDYVSFAQFYLRPSGYSIKNQKTILKLYDAIRKAKKTSDYTFSGILSYQVFLDKKGKILIATQIVNYDSCIAYRKCYLKKGWIHFSEDDDEICTLNVNSPEYCRIIYNFMKKHIPKRIEKLNNLYKKQGGLEKQLFNKK